MLAILRQPLNRGTHLRVIRSVADLPHELHVDAELAPIHHLKADAVGQMTAEEIVELQPWLRFHRATALITARGVREDSQ